MPLRQGQRVGWIATATLAALLTGCGATQSTSAPGSDPVPLQREPRPFVSDFASFWDQSRLMMPPFDGSSWDGSGWAYVANEVAGGISVVDLQTGKPVKFIGGGNTTHHVHLTKDQKWAIATNRYGNFLFAINTADNSWHKITIPGDKPAGPLHLGISPDGKYALSTLNGIGAVAVIDSNSATLVKVVEGVGKQPRDIVFSSDSKKAYVSLQGDPFVTIIDMETLKISGKIDVPEAKGGSGGMAMSADGKLIALTSTKDKLVAVIDTTTDKVVSVIKEIPEPVNPQFLGKTKWLTTGNRGNDTFSVIDTSSMKLIKHVPSAPGVNIPSLGPDGLVYVTGNGSKYVSIHDPAKEFEKVGQIDVVLNAHWMIYAPDGRTGYVTNWGAQGISVVDLVDRKQLSYIQTGSNPNGIAVKFNVPKEAREKALANSEAAAQDVKDSSVLVVPTARTAQEKMFMNTCLVCHDAGRIIRNNSQTEAQWGAIVTRMKRNGAKMTDESQREILQYLVLGQHRTLDIKTKWQEKYGTDGSKIEDHSGH